MSSSPNCLHMTMKPGWQATFVLDGMTAKDSETCLSVGGELYVLDGMGSHGTGLDRVEVLDFLRADLIPQARWETRHPTPVYADGVYCSRAQRYGQPHDGECNGLPTRSCHFWAGP